MLAEGISHALLQNSDVVRNAATETQLPESHNCEMPERLKCSTESHRLDQESPRRGMAGHLFELLERDCRPGNERCLLQEYALL